MITISVSKLSNVSFSLKLFLMIIWNWHEKSEKESNINKLLTTKIVRNQVDFIGMSIVISKTFQIKLHFLFFIWKEHFPTRRITFCISKSLNSV